MSDDPILQVVPLSMPWASADPFLFCVHHDDRYPAGNERLGPATSLEGREIGQDFGGKDGWSMYHGAVVPGFPQHPHRGFETVTIVRQGLIDHSDSLGAAARFGGGDVQWLTAGRGIVHSEMFPLLDRQGGNHLELFQIWVNLPRADKLVEPHFSMLWSREIPKVEVGEGAEVTVVAGRLGSVAAPAPPPKSWAAREENGVAIWLIRLQPGARFVLPAAMRGVLRTLYLFRGGPILVGERSIAAKSGVLVREEAEVALAGGEVESELLLLQGRPIGEPVAQYGPFVMSSREEIQQAFADYRRTQFGGWPWPSDDPVHPRGEGRFARHADGKIERGG